MGIIYDSDLTNFYFSSAMEMGPVPMVWWAYDEDEDGELNPRAFTLEEGKLFEQFIVSNPQNFPEASKQYHHVENDDEYNIPMVDLLDEMPIEIGSYFPSFYVLRKNPTKYKGQIMGTMDINLSPSHNYNLPFMAIGAIRR